MAKKKNTQQTSGKVAAKASKLLSDPKSTKTVKSVAASALTQSHLQNKRKGK